MLWSSRQPHYLGETRPTATTAPSSKQGAWKPSRALDRDKDGRLTLAEFMTQGWCQAVPSCQCQDAARQLFSRMDKNGDGFVTIEEFQASAREKQRPGGAQ